MMKRNIVQKIIGEHLVEGELKPGSPVSVSIDQTLTQDATGTMAYLQFMAMGFDSVKTKLSVSYIDHNTLQNDHLNADDHVFLRTAASRYGVVFSRPGNGICHQLHLENFAVPGQTLLGSDSHTPTCGGIGMLAIGAGGLNVAAAMAGEPFNFIMPEVVGIELTGRLANMAGAKDVILEVLRLLTVKGGVNKAVEYRGSGVLELDIPERATICNMGAELGATSSVFPSDRATMEFLSLQQRPGDFRALESDEGCKYEKDILIDLSGLEPLIAKPHSPDNVDKVRNVKGVKVHQVIIGSCTNSSVRDMLTAAKVLEGRRVHPSVDLCIAPGSRQVFDLMAGQGVLAQFIRAGARILESACGPCIGMGQAPRSGGVSVRSFNRNFKGRSGTEDAQVYLAGPAVCAACAITGQITDPRDLCLDLSIEMPKTLHVDRKIFIFPPKKRDDIEIEMGPGIKPVPAGVPLPESVSGIVLIKLGDNITTDHIMPAGAKVLPLRSNIPEISKYVFHKVDSGFYEKAKKYGGGFIIGGSNYGQGSSREHAALAPMYLGVKAVICKSFARIHRENLINFGILPLVFKDAKDYDTLQSDDELRVMNLRSAIETETFFEVHNATQKTNITIMVDLDARERKLILAGGYLNYIKTRKQGSQ